jgi:hypothetical protein
MTTWPSLTCRAPSSGAQIGRVLGPGVGLYFKALRTLALVFAGLVTTCVPRAGAQRSAAHAEP